MQVISILNPKGGCGKTTIATNLAHVWMASGKRILLVDSDPQGSARDWHAAREDNPLPLVALDRAGSLRSISSVGRGYDLVVIDGAAKLEDIVAAAIKVSDFVLIPVQPSPYDIWATSDFVDLIRSRQEVTDGKPKAAFCISRAIRNTRLGREVVDALAVYDIPVLQATTVQRQTYARGVNTGLSVLNERGSAAADEIRALASEILTEHLLLDGIGTNVA